MNAQARWQLQLPERPSQAGQDRNNKFSLKSGVIDWLEKNRLGCSHESVDSQGSRFVNTLTDVLWYIDGHQEALKLLILPEFRESPNCLHSNISAFTIFSTLV